MTPLRLNKGVTKFQYNKKIYDFKKIIFNKLEDYSKINNNVRISSLEELHKNRNLKENVEIYRQLCFETFKSKKFQKIYKKFGIFLIDKFFDKKALLQRSPTIRIHLPGQQCTPYHSDTWYGHGSSVRTFWVPLTTVNKDNTLFVSKKLEDSLRLMKQIEKIKPTYKQIHKLSKKICQPLTGKPGDIFSFSSQLIHGTEVAKKSNTRISFDFRIAKNANDLGIKSKSNFYSFSELKKINKQKQKKQLIGLFYTNYCNSISAKNQLLFCNLFCKENNIQIKGGDSEILPLKYLPVLRNYLTDKKLKINCIVVYSLEIFDTNIKNTAEILELAKRNKIKLIFCNENIFFDQNSDISNTIRLIK